MTAPIVLGIAGGTGAGKSALAKRLLEALGGDENVSYLVHDSYYRGFADKTLEERSRTNFDHPDSLETELLVQHVRDLKNGREVNVPVYDYGTHTRKEETILVPPAKVIMVEGILVFSHPDLVHEMDIKVFVDADSDIRLMRRLRRDNEERGRSVDEVLERYTDTVRPMHDLYVEPSKKRADLIVHSTGHSMDVAIQVLTNHLMVAAGIGIGRAEEQETTTTTTETAEKQKG